MKHLTVTITLIFFVFCFQKDVFATGASYLKIKIVPVTYNDKGEVLLKTRYKVNQTGARNYMEIEYGWLVVSAAGVWEESLHKLCTPDLNNIKPYKQCEKEFEKDFSWDAPPVSVLAILKKYKFTKKDLIPKLIHSKDSDKIIARDCSQKSIHGIMEDNIGTTDDNTNKAVPFFSYAGISIYNNYCDELSTVGAEFNFPHLYKEKKLNENEEEFIEDYNIDAICIFDERK